MVVDFIKAIISLTSKIDVTNLLSGIIGCVITSIVTWLVTRHYYKKQRADKMERGKSILRIEINELLKKISTFQSPEFIARVNFEYENEKTSNTFLNFKRTVENEINKFKEILANPNYLFTGKVKKNLEELILRLHNLLDYDCKEISQVFYGVIGGRKSKFLQDIEEITKLCEAILKQL